MSHSVSLAELQRTGLVLTADEAVAIALQLIDPPANVPLQPPFGPVSADRICIGTDGTVSCAGCAATPSVAELAILLQQLLKTTRQVPGGLRYAIARALHEVDVPPFDSLDEFANALLRYAPGARADALRRIVVRCDRRRPAQSSADLRQHLREADLQLYEARSHAADAAPRENGRGTHRWLTAALFSGALMLVAAGSAVGDRAPDMPAPPPPPMRATAAAAIDAPEPHAVLVSPPAHRKRSAPKHPVREVHAHSIRLRWFHTTIAIKDDLARP